MRATPQEALDLAHLAIDRARDAVGSVTQLMDPLDLRTHAILTAVAVDMVRASADCLQDGMEAQNGKRPPTRDALAHVIAEICGVLELEKGSGERKATGMTSGIVATASDAFDILRNKK